jgi:nucleoside-diphosphate-sugar epimerase
MAILMTGVTGVMGAEIGLALKEFEDVFFLVRKESLLKVPKEIAESRIIVGDIVLPMCGISPHDMVKLVGVTKILHLAADVSFSPVDKDGNIRLVNYDGTKNVLDVALELGIDELHYCSTAYASTRRNPYEISKNDAENMAIDFCQKQGIKYSIYKPSAIVGDYTTGVSNGFNGFVGASAIFNFLAANIRKREGREIVSLPIYFVCSTNSTMNLIPVDWVSETFIKLYPLGARNETYHLTHNHPPKARWVIEEGFKNLGITDIRYIEEPIDAEEKEKLHGKGSQILKYQKMVDRVLDQFHPYCLSEKEFPLNVTAAALDKDFKDPPPVTEDFVAKLFKYAIGVNFEAPRN